MRPFQDASRTQVLNIFQDASSIVRKIKFCDQPVVTWSWMIPSWTSHKEIYRTPEKVFFWVAVHFLFYIWHIARNFNNIHIFALDHSRKGRQERMIHSFVLYLWGIKQSQYIFSDYICVLPLLYTQEPTITIYILCTNFHRDTLVNQTLHCAHWRNV